LEYLDTKQAGFKLLFSFSPNEFFEDSVLTKTYYYQEDIGYGGEFVYDKAVGHDIKWKEEKDLTKTVEIKKQRNKSESYDFVSLPLLIICHRHQPNPSHQEGHPHGFVLQLLQASSATFDGRPRGR
jgi:hypothetical protein